LAGNVAFCTWPSLGCPSGIGWREELVAVVGRPTTAVLRGKGRFAFVGMFPQVFYVCGKGSLIQKDGTTTITTPAATTGLIAISPFFLIF
jgi:hypothetical protein